MATPEAVTPSPLRKGFQLGAWRIWPDAGQIEKDGRKRHIEPKLVEVLLLLAANPGQVITRESLLDHAWQRQVVCDEALTRAISELRTLLGDNERERRYIRTVPKRGYSLIADVGPIAETVEQAATAVNYASSSTPKIWPRRLIQYWLYGTGSLATAAGVVCVLILALAEDVTVAITEDRDTPNLWASAGNKVGDIRGTTSVVPTLNRMAVLPFTNLTPDRELSFFTQGLEEDIRAALADLPGAQVAGRIISNQFQPLDSKATADKLKAIAGKLNVQAIIDGTVRLVDGQIRVTVQLLCVDTGFPLWSQSYDQTFDSVLSLQSQIAGDVAGEIRRYLSEPAKMVVAIKPKPQRSKEEELSLPVEEYGHTRHIEWLVR